MRTIYILFWVHADKQEATMATMTPKMPRLGAGKRAGLRVAEATIIALAAALALLEGAAGREPIRKTLTALRCELFHHTSHVRVSIDSSGSPWISTYECSTCKRVWRLP